MPGRRAAVVVENLTQDLVTGRDAWKERVCMEKEGQIPYADCKQLENTLFASV